MINYGLLKYGGYTGHQTKPNISNLQSKSFKIYHFVYHLL